MVEQSIFIGGRRYNTSKNGTFLSFYYCGIKDLPKEGFGDEFASLKTLELHCNHLTFLPCGGFDKLVKLEKLNLTGNKLTYLPEGIFDKLVKLKELRLTGNILTSLPEGIFDKLVNLEILKYSGEMNLGMFDNNINLKELTIYHLGLPPPSGILDNLVNLTDFRLSADCGYYYPIRLPDGFFDKNINMEVLRLQCNNLTYIPKRIFDNLVKLKDLNLSHNKISSLPGGIFDNLVNLTLVYLTDNILTFLSENVFDNNTSLVHISLSKNLLTSLPENLFNKNILLKFLLLGDNKLEVIPEGLLKNLVNLIDFKCFNNELISLPLSLRNCRSLVSFYYGGNPIEYIPPQVQRFLDRLRNRAIQSISKDNQNVHDSAIQRSLNTSIFNLLKEKPVLTTEEVVTFITNSEFITSEAKSYLLTYSEDETIHSVHDVTFSEVLTSVISEIISLKEEDEVLKILSEEISDSICKCFTGRISRLVNSLNGFSPKVKVEISKNTQISTILAQTSES